jgi:hypothetical protein
VVLLGRGVAVQSGGSGGHVSDTTGAHSVTCSGFVARGVVYLLYCVEVSSLSCVIPLTRYASSCRVAKSQSARLGKAHSREHVIAEAAAGGLLGLVIGASRLRHQGSIST